MNIKQHKFVTEYLRNGNAMVAYWLAYNVKEPNGKAAESAANRLLRHPEIKEAIYQAEGRIRDAVEREVAARRVEEVFSIEEKRALLKKIATGQIMVEQYYKGKDCHMCTQYARPNFWHMLSAIKEDSRIAGHYPAQQKTTTKRSVLIDTNEKDIDKEITKIKSSFPVFREGGFRPQEEDGRVDYDSIQGQTEEFSQQPNEPSLQQTERQQPSESSSQQNTTTNQEKSSERGFRGPTRDEQSSQQPSEAASLSPLKETSTRQQNTTTEPTDLAATNKEDTTNPHPGGTGLPTITHDELMQLLYPNKYKMKQPD